MAGIPEGEFTLKMGKTFTTPLQDRPEYHTLRYDFKPQSVTSNTTDSFIRMGTEEVQIVHADQGDDVSIFQGVQKPTCSEKECLFFYDETTGAITIEKLDSNIFAKQSRSMDIKRDMLKKIERMRPGGSKETASCSRPSEHRDELLDDVSGASPASTSTRTTSSSPHSTVSADKSVSKSPFDYLDEPCKPKKQQPDSTLLVELELSESSSEDEA
ncbi:unnamed protein product, partial [Mesorhabditis spiculigera]